MPEFRDHPEIDAEGEDRRLALEIPTVGAPAVQPEVGAKSLPGGPPKPKRTARGGFDNGRRNGERGHGTLRSSAFRSADLEKCRARARYKATMHLAPIARFAVPTGTAAATVVLAEPTGDPDIDSRRFAALESLPDPDYRGAFEELIVAGVYAVLADRVLALRVNRSGARSFAALVAIRGAVGGEIHGENHGEIHGKNHGEIRRPRAGLASVAAAFGADPNSSKAQRLRELLEHEARQRPVFHGMTADGVTYSGFEAQATADILAAAAAIVPASAAPCHVAFVYAGEPLDLPRGLAVGLLPATS